jgi:alpha-mannosidase
MNLSANSTYENQFGFIQRPTHRNTTWHRAQFEVCGHRFADVSEFGYGVALLNDSKYGHACENSTLRLSLLRASTLPDDEQDQGAHHFSFAVLPHRGSFAESDVPAVARMFNYPLHLRRLPSLALTESELIKSRDDRHGQGPFSVVGARNVVLDTVKRGEEDDFSARSKHETVILRLYEAYGGAAKAKIAATVPEGRKIASAELVDVRPSSLRPEKGHILTMSPADPRAQSRRPRRLRQERLWLRQQHLQHRPSSHARLPDCHRQADPGLRELRLSVPSCLRISYKVIVPCNTRCSLYVPAQIWRSVRDASWQQ